MIWLDTETRSPVPINFGTDRYMAEAECLMVTWVRDDGKPQLWETIRGQPAPLDLADAFADPNELLCAHHVSFDRAVLTRCLGLTLPIQRFRCSMACAVSHGFPGSLGTLGQVLELPDDQQKLADGRRLINIFCIPHDEAGTYFDYSTHPEDWRKFCEYGIQDTATLREIWKRLPKHNYEGPNLETWFIDQLINERGFGFDQDLALAARSLLERAKGRHEKEMRAATDDEVWAATQREKLKKYLESKGLTLPNMRASTISDWLEHDDLSPELRFLLEARLEASKSSGAKYRRGLEMVGDGSRIRYGMRFAGAGRTGRFSHRGFQPGNLKRASVKFDQILTEIRLLKSGNLDMFYDV